MRRWLGVLGLVLVGLATLGCQNEDPGPTGPGTIIITQTQTINGGTNGQPAASPAPGGTCAALHLGCDQMTGPGGEAQPGCGAQLADYTAPAGTVGRLDATPVDAAGQKLDGFAVSGWASVGACSLTGETFGPEGFNPTIHMGSGECIVSVGVPGCQPASRKFIGQ